VRNGFIERLAAARIGATCNFYRDGDPAACRSDRSPVDARRRRVQPLRSQLYQSWYS
jgi:hypothetical protein